MGAPECFLYLFFYCDSILCIHAYRMEIARGDIINCLSNWRRGNEDVQILFLVFRGCAGGADRDQARFVAADPSSALAPVLSMAGCASAVAFQIDSNRYLGFFPIVPARFSRAKYYYASPLRDGGDRSKTEYCSLSIFVRRVQ
jgi:hypothetical protein